MTYDDSIFSIFNQMSIELPYTCLNSFNYVCPTIKKDIKVSSKMREIGKDFGDVNSLRLCDKIVNLTQNTSSLKALHTPLSCDKSLADLEDCTEVVNLL